MTPSSRSSSLHRAISVELSVSYSRSSTTRLLVPRFSDISMAFPIVHANRRECRPLDRSCYFDRRILATNTVSCCMQCWRSISGVAYFDLIKLRTCERAVTLPGRDVDEPCMNITYGRPSPCALRRLLSTKLRISAMFSSYETNRSRRPKWKSISSSRDKFRRDR